MSSKTHKISVKAENRRLKNALSWVNMYIGERNLQQDFDEFIKEKTRDVKRNNTDT